MKPLFTIHGGEYLFGITMELRFPELRIWIPAKDDGIDFLVTDVEHKKTLSVQVKYSKDFNWSHGNPVLKPHVKSAGWYSLNREKIENSKADYWVMVNYDGVKKNTDFLFIKPQDLLTKYDSLGRTGKRIESYIMVMNNGECYETRGMRKREMNTILSGSLSNTNRCLKPYIEEWGVIEKYFS